MVIIISSSSNIVSNISVGDMVLLWWLKDDDPRAAGK
jgi:hypothetical protein